WGSRDLNELPWLDLPPAAGVSRAADLLQRLGVRQDGQLTRHGQAVALLPVHPRLGHMLLWAAQRGVAEKACAMAVCVEEQNRQLSQVDLAGSLTRRVSPTVQRRISQLRSMLGGEVDMTNANMAGPSTPVVLAQAFPDWIARQRTGQPGCFVLACGAEVTLDANDPLAHSPWLVIAQLGGSGVRARIIKAISLDIDELEQFAAELFSTIDNLEWDNREQRVLATCRTTLGHLVVREQPMQSIDDHQRAMALLSGIRNLGIDCLPWNDACRDWQARVIRVHGLLDANAANRWPRVNDTGLMEKLEDWLLPYVQGMATLKALRKLDLKQALESLLDYQQKRLLDTWLPSHYTVPSGSRIRLDYTKPGNPVLSVRLQEMFGCTTNPRLADGRLPLTVELLSPARRPVQVTEDLANFWTNSYPAVKKEMAGRYPKHVWPDDPRAAAPTSRAKPRKPAK
ncbi:ATP-dependent helicase HrpB, partial [Granulosicoccus sp.]|nr:ATP-dependent helicase HrpB [Granulosicoccus sp.]